MTASSMLAAAMRRKHSVPPNDAFNADAEADRPLNLIDLVLLGVGGTLGSGLFLLAGRAAREVAGPAITLSFLFAAIACMFSGLSYAEMASRNPNSGGAYAFTYTSLGELPAFLVGMCLTLEYGVSSAAIARSWASYLGDSVGFLPGWAVGKNSIFSVMAALLILAAAAMLAVGMREAKWVINGTTAIYAMVVVVILAFGSQNIDTDNWTPFFPFGSHGIIAGSSAVFFAFVGFDEVAVVAEEAQDSGRTVPLAILLSLSIVSAMYVSASFVLTGMVNYATVDIDAPFSAAFRTVGQPLIAKLVGFGTSLGMMNTAVVSLAAQPRIFVSMGRDGLLPRSFAYSTRSTTLVCGLIVSLLAVVVRTQALADLVSGGTLLAFLATNVSLLLTRSRIHTHSRQNPWLIHCFVGASALAGLIGRFTGNGAIPRWLGLTVSVPALFVPTSFLLSAEFQGGIAHERVSPTFLCPLVPFVPMCGAFTTSFLLFQLSGHALSALCTWLAVAVTSYFCYGAKNAIIANEYLTLNDGSPANSYNSFDHLAMEAHSISSENDSSTPSSPIPSPNDEVST